MAGEAWRIMLCATTLFAGLDTVALAQSAAEEEDIVVTARRREEALQSVPITVTAFTGEQLREQSISTTEELQFHTPALQVVGTTYGPSVPSFTIRSQRQLEPIITQDPSVSIYFADVAQARPHGVNASLWDLDSVQVLKGPQGTLFGRNTTGGAILITPARPDLEAFGGYSALRVGDYDMLGGTFVFNVPLSDEFAVRVGANADTHEGYSTNVLTGEKLDNQNAYSWRLSALWRPTTTFETLFIYSAFEDINNGVAQRLTATRLASQADDLARAQALDFHEFESNLDPRFAKAQSSNLGNITTIDLSSTLTFKNIVGYRSVSAHTSEDTDGSSEAIFESFYELDADQFSEEAQLLGRALDNRLDWIVGAYYFQEDGNDMQDSLLFGLRHSEASATNTSYSVYAQGTYDTPWLEGLSLTAGLRQTWDEREITARNRTNGVCRILTANIGGVPISPCEKTVSTEFDQLTWTLTADYQVNEDTLLYGTVRTGYRSGGFNLRAGIPREFEPFRPETVTDYEIGLKADWSLAGAPVRTNLSIYYDQYEDVQRTNSFIDPDIGAFTTIVFNAQQATIQGFEADATIEPIEGLELRAYYSYSDASYDEWRLPNGVDLSANQFSFAPEHSGGGSIRYEWPLGGDMGQIAAQIDYFTQSEIQFTDVNEPTGVGAAYELWNLRADWNDLGGQPVDLSLFVKNALDEEYHPAGNTTYVSVGFSSGFLGAPRTIGAELRYRFGAEAD
ncbi:TonB-dependent receptor [Terricaulis silvestris]|uniref:Pesticin receptor n=1 Tax=Terricaulis silvestris TaxID=2686094 RepID=A0A6I6MRU2_9CAUL|nr:TonB-dependent receptor [Terricaulis silvestris]QGZ96136.1 Pesticin receptor [Terricaulis silvestris]